MSDELKYRDVAHALVIPSSPLNKTGVAFELFNEAVERKTEAVSVMRFPNEMFLPATFVRSLKAEWRRYAAKKHRQREQRGIKLYIKRRA